MNFDKPLTLEGNFRLVTLHTKVRTFYRQRSPCLDGLNLKPLCKLSSQTITYSAIAYYSIVQNYM